jgi:uncharacterized RDD family membrane protein YckC
MKCPKCQYIGFDDADRCRNCGYEFSLVLDDPPLDLAIQDGSEPLGPFADFSLKDLDGPVQAPPDPSAPNAASAAPRPSTQTSELPLFRADRVRVEDVPLITPPSVPRPPLAVRRPAPATPRPRPRREPTPPEPRLALDTAEIPIVPERSAPLAAPPVPAAVAAPLGARLLAGLVDLTLMAGIDLCVLYFTLRICELTFRDIRALPLAPTFGFLALLNGGYLACFVAAGGQTIGKMATGIRVVPGDPAAAPSERVPMGRAVVRAAVYPVSVLPIGLGLVPALVQEDRRALHDHLADTRVVKA